MKSHESMDYLDTPQATLQDRQSDPQMACHSDRMGATSSYKGCNGRSPPSVALHKALGCVITVAQVILKHHTRPQAGDVKLCDDVHDAVARRHAPLHNGILEYFKTFQTCTSLGQMLERKSIQEALLALPDPGKMFQRMVHV